MNSEILKPFGTSSSYMLLLSATICDKPEYFKVFGYVLGLYNEPKKYKLWVENKGVNFDNPMIGVNKFIFPEYASRMSIKKLGNLFPINQVVAKCYDMDCQKEIQEMYDIIKDAEQDLKKKEEASCGLGRIVRARQRIEILKAPTIIEQVKKFVDEGNSVVVFVNFTETLLTIAKEVKSKCLVYGQQHIDVRMANIKRFQDDKERIILCNIAAGGLV